MMKEMDNALVKEAGLDWSALGESTLDVYFRNELMDAIVHIYKHNLAKCCRAPLKTSLHAQ